MKKKYHAAAIWTARLGCKLMLAIARVFMWFYNAFAGVTVRHCAALESLDQKPAEGEVKVVFNVN